MNTALDAHALDEAAGQGDVARIQYLLLVGKPWATQALDDALASAVEGGHTVVADQLVAQGAQPDTLTRETWQAALDDPRLTGLSWLIGRVSARGDDSLSLRLAMGQKRWAAALLLVPHSQVTANDSEALRHGLERGAPLPLLQALVDQGADLAGQLGHLSTVTDASIWVWVLEQVPVGQVLAALRDRQHWGALDRVLLQVDLAQVADQLAQGGPLPRAQDRWRSEQRRAKLASRPASTTGTGRRRS